MYLRDSDLNGYLANNNLKMNLKKDEDQITIELKKKIEIVTPVLKSIYSSNYELKTERMFYDE